MTARAVHWHEGMFLRPHHLQTATRHLQRLAYLGSQWDNHYNWGIRHVEIDEAALANHRLVVRQLDARLRDGTLVMIPEEGTLPAVELKTALAGTATNVTAYVGVPVLQLGRSNVAANGELEGGRYRIDSLADLEDENKAGNPQTIQVRTLNVRLLLSTQDHAGYETLPIALIEKGGQAEAPPQLARSFIPPLLACDAWKPLAADVLQNLYDRLGKTIDLHVQHFLARNTTLNYESNAAGDHTVIEQLRSDNEGYAVLRALAFAQGVHPFDAYVALCRLAGQLAIWGKRLGPRAPELPIYNHDDLGGCFGTLKKVLDELIDDQGRPEIEWRNFTSTASRMQVTLERRWLQPAYRLFVRVASKLQRQKTIELFTRPGKLDMKIGSPSRVDEMYRFGQKGLYFAYAAVPPAALPSGDEFVYFDLGREQKQDAQQKEEWKKVEDEHALAIRFNDAYLPGGIPQGRQEITIRVDGATMANMQFTLFVVPQER